MRLTNRLLVPLVSSVALSIVVLGVLATTSRATFPGANGPIAFTQNAQIFTMNANGSGKVQLAADHRNLAPSFSANGARIVFAHGFRPANSSIEIMTASGTNRRAVIQGGSPTDPSFSPGGTRIVFTRLAKAGVFVAHADGAQVRKLGTGRGCDSNASFSPSGKFIVFERLVPCSGGTPEIDIMHSDGTHRRGLVVNRSENSDPSFAPGGKRVLFVARHRSNADVTDIRAIGINGKGRQVIATGPGSKLEYGSPSYSPDASQIAFTGSDLSNPEGGYSRDVFVMKANGTGQHQITHSGTAFASDWGPASP